ncbi:MAG TPA: hypothetical protein VN442_15440 [Bryobacteraceae bacterium]|nr:hypothetical protein [Bryobacteraceae bacterium]
MPTALAARRSMIEAVQEWITAEVIDRAQLELARHRTLSREGVERTAIGALPDPEITKQILNRFSSWQEFAEFLKALLRRYDTATINSYGFYVTAAIRRWAGGRYETAVRNAQPEKK